MNKRNYFFCFILLTVINNIYAITPSTLYDRSSIVIESIDYLARRSNIIGIYDNFPTTGANVVSTLKQIDRSKLSNVEKKIYDDVEKEINKDFNLIKKKDDVSINGEIPLTLESFIYNTSDNTQLRRYELTQQFKDVSPWLDFRGQLLFGNLIYGYTQFAIKDRLNYSLDTLAPKIGSNLRSFSIIPNDGKNFETYQPFKIGLSVGDEKFNFQIGKNRLSVGSGITGNFFIGDNFSKQDYASFSLFSSIIKYSFSISEFDQQSDHLKFDPISFNGKHQYRVMNRMRFEFFKNFSIDIFQGSLYQIDGVNLRMLIPFMYVHNYFDFADNKTISGNDEANNIFGIQTKWVINQGNELNFNLTVDQIQFFESTVEFPQAYGIQINFKNSIPFKSGMLNNSFEFVYTSPYLYLNEKIDEKGNLNYNYDHIYGNNYGSYDEIGYSGYYYGPDTIMIAYQINYNEFKRWKLGADLNLRIHGKKGINYNKDIYDDILNSPIDNSFIVGIPETILSFSPQAFVNITNNLSISTILNFRTIFNHYHNTAAPPLNVFEAQIGVKYNLL